MSWETEQWARKQRVGDPVRKAVLVAIANEADTSGLNAFPSIRYIAFDVEVSERTVQRRLHELEEMGFIRRVRRQRPDGSQSSNGYDLIGYEPPLQWKDRQRRGPRGGGDNLSPSPDNLSPTHDADVTPPGDTAVTPKTSDELPFPPASGDKSPEAPPDGGQPPAGVSKPVKRGSRLPEDWQPPPVGELPLALQAVVRQWPTGAYEFVAARFIAHWLSTPGAKATKLSWIRAWHNWIPGDGALVMRLKRDGVDFAEATRHASGDPPAAPSMILCRQKDEPEEVQNLRRALNRALGPRTYDGWMKPTVLSIDDGTLVVMTISPFMRDWITVHLADRIALTARAELGRPVRVDVVTAET